MSKFKVGDRVVRTECIEDFRFATSPVVVTGVFKNGTCYCITVEGSRDHWFEEYFELYQPEQPEVKPQSQPMQPLVSIYDKALDLRFEHEYLGDVSLREFFCTLLVKLWNDPCGFSGKRPWGNSGWDEPVYAALIKAGIISGKLDSEGYIEDCDYVTGDEFVSKMIAHAFGCSLDKD